MSSKLKTISFDLSDEQEKELFEKIGSHTEKFATRTKQLWADHLDLTYEVKKVGRKPFVDHELIEKQKAEKREELKAKQIERRNEKAHKQLTSIIEREVRTKTNALVRLQIKLTKAKTDFEKNNISTLIDITKSNLEQLKSQLNESL